MFNRTRSYLLTGIILLAVLSSCVPENSTETSAPGQPVPVTVTEESAPSPTPTSKPRELPTAVPQPTLPAITYGPDQADFPANVNPLTGLQVADPSRLEQPALLVSITHFPPEVRPQGGLSFAPWVFEYLIATGTTRFAAVFTDNSPTPRHP